MLPSILVFRLHRSGMLSEIMRLEPKLLRSSTIIRSWFSGGGDQPTVFEKILAGRQPLSN